MPEEDKPTQCNWLGCEETEGLEKVVAHMEVQDSEGNRLNDSQDPLDQRVFVHEDGRLCRPHWVELGNIIRQAFFGPFEYGERE